MSASRASYRTLMVAIYPFVPFWLLLGYLIRGAPEYWDDLKRLYRAWPRAFRKGAPL